MLAKMKTGRDASICRSISILAPPGSIAKRSCYQRGCNANPGCTRTYADCVIEEYGKPGEDWVIVITADEIATLAHNIRFFYRFDWTLAASGGAYTRR